VVLSTIKPKTKPIKYWFDYIST